MFTIRPGGGAKTFARFLKKKMKKERVNIGLEWIQLNEGQLPWLPKNPRKWTQTDIDKTAASIKEDPDFLEDRPLLVVSLEDTPYFIVFAGNLRSEGAKAAGRALVPCVLYTPESAEDYETIRRRAMKDNGSFGQFDWDEVFSSPWGQMDLDAMGIGKAFQQGGDPFNESAKDETGEQPQAKEDDFDENADAIQVRCKPGDIWQLGEHRLMCGDSIDLEQVKTLMGGALADMVFTDPPYGVSYTEKNTFLNRIGKSLSCVNPIENDSHSPEEMADFWTKAFSVLAECTKERMVYYITAPQGGDLLLLQSIENTPFALKHMLIWNKNRHVLGRCDYNYKHEPIIYGWKKKGTHHFYGGGEFKTTVWDIPKPLKNDLHPTMKPIALVANCILDGTKEGDLVLDTFGGSGTTIIAAEQTGRKCYMMELDPHYCDVILARWEKLTGKTAVKVSA